jgi:hypothetical protein
MTAKEREAWFHHEGGTDVRSTPETRYLNGAGRGKFGFVTDWLTKRMGREWYHQGHICGKIGKHER